MAFALPASTAARPSPFPSYLAPCICRSPLFSPPGPLAASPPLPLLSLSSHRTCRPLLRISSGVWMMQASCSEIAAAAFATWVAPGSALQVGPSGRDRRVTAIASAAAKAGKSRKGTVADVWGIKAQAAMGSAPGSVPAGDPVEIKKEKAAKPASSTTLQDVNSPRRSDQRNQESADGGPNQSAQQQDIESESDSSESDMD